MRLRTAASSAANGDGVTGQCFRVLMIAPTFFFGDNGCHVRILEEARALQARGCEVRVCTYFGGKDVDGLTIHRARRVPWRAGIHVGSSRSKPILDFLLFLRTLQVAIAHRPEVIHAHIHEGALIGLLVGRLLRIPVVFDFQGSLTSEMLDHNFLHRDSALFRPLLWLEGVLDRAADVVLTSTRYSAELLLRRFGCRRERVRPLSDAVNTDVFAPRWSVAPAALASLRRRLGIPDGRRLVVYIGLLAEYQGTSHLLEAAKIVIGERSDTHFLLMGYPGQERYRDAADALGIGGHVTFTGRLPYGEAPLHLALGDLAVAPKMSETEGNGKLLNYMSVGLPTVAFDAPVNREFLGEAGDYAGFGDIDDLARQMLRLLAAPEAAAARGRLLRERAVEQFSWTSGVQALLDVYAELVGSGARRGFAEGARSAGATIRGA